MTDVTITPRRPAPESRPTGRSRTRRSVAEKIRAMGLNRTGAILLLVATAVAILWASLAGGSYETF